MNLSDFLLLADIEDVLKTALPIIFMILYGVAQLVGGKQQKKNRKPPAQRPRPAPPEMPGAPGAAPQQGAAKPNLEQSLRREVEEFLRRAQGQPPAGPAKREPGSRPQPTGSGRPGSRRPERTSPQRPEPPRREPETRRLTPSSTPISPMGSPGSTSTLSPAPLGAGVAQHVAQHIGGAASIVEHSKQLGADVAMADDRLEQHIKEKFVHQVGTLAHQATATQRRTDAASPMAGELLKLLSRPEGVRQAFLAGEIFRPLEDRWD